MSQEDRDASEALREAMRQAVEQGRPRYFAGGGSKASLLGRRCDADTLDVTAHRGVISYRPTEMVITARAGTPVSDIAALIDAEGQRLPFETALAGGRATIGGCVASGLSAAARPWRGDIRDAVLGLRLLNGRAELLRFGGEVMKNVAGYDVSRLQCGALGCLGLICDVSLRLLPQAERSLSMVRSLSAPEAIREMRRLTRQSLPLSGLCWYNEQLKLRFEGNRQSVDAARRTLEPDWEIDEAPPWEALRELRHPALNSAPLVCVDVAPATALEEAPALIDWAGARRYYRSDDLERLQRLAAAAGGHARRLWCGDRPEEALPAPPPAMRVVLGRLKAALDPQGLCNPGRLYHWL